MGLTIRSAIGSPHRSFLLVVVLAAAWAWPAAAQRAAPDREEYSRFSGSMAFLNTQPLGSLSTGPGFGVDLSAAWALDPARRFRVRGELRGAMYGRDTRTACLSETVGCLIEVDVDTDYGSYFVGVGPELAVPVVGSTLILDATAGVAGFSVSSSVRGTADFDGEDLLSTNNFSDTFFAWSAGGELRVPVAPVVSLSVGGHYQHNGEASYVPEGGVTRNAHGTVDVAAVTTDANMFTITVGVAFHPFVGWTEEMEDGEDG